VSTLCDSTLGFGILHFTDSILVCSPDLVEFLVLHNLLSGDEPKWDIPPELYEVVLRLSLLTEQHKRSQLAKNLFVTAHTVLFMECSSRVSSERSHWERSDHTSLVSANI
jgi:hypothetical protein